MTSYRLFHPFLEVIILARPVFGPGFGQNFSARGPTRSFFFCLWAGFGQAKNDFLVYFLARPVLARKSPLSTARNSGLWIQKFGPNLGPANGQIFLAAARPMITSNPFTYNVILYKITLYVKG